MDTTHLAAHLVPLAQDLHGAIASMEPQTLRRTGTGPVHNHLQQLRQRIPPVLSQVTRVREMSMVQQALTRIAQVLEDLPPSDATQRSARRDWRRFRAKLHRAYAMWSRALAAWDIHVPHLRPFNPTRNLFHAGWATIAALILGLFPDRTLLLACITPILVWAWTMEGLRQRWPSLNRWLMRAFAPVAHPHEHHRVNSATWYTTALFILALLDIPTASMVALIVLGYADPAAAFLGRRFGRVPLLHGRTLEGTLGFFVVGTVASWTALASVTATPPGHALLIGVAGSFAGAVAELLSRRIDDNLSIPLTSALAAQAALHLF